MKKSVSNVVAGGLIAGATVMGMDAIHNPASAAIMESTQMQNFSFDFSANAATCCYDSNIADKDFVFKGFDNSLGVLDTVTLDISFLSPTIPTVVSQSSGGIKIVGEDGNTAVLVANDFVNNLDMIDLGGTRFGTALFDGDKNTVSLDFTMLFNDGAVSAALGATPMGMGSGSMTLSYIYDDLTVVPIPGSAALMAPALAALFASGVYSRRRREEDE
jgi:hypothetical protein